MAYFQVLIFIVTMEEWQSMILKVNLDLLDFGKFQRIKSLIFGCFYLKTEASSREITVQILQIKYSVPMKMIQHFVKYGEWKEMILRILDLILA